MTLRSTLYTVLLVLGIIGFGYSQPVSLTYYLPDISYDESIPTPQEYLGYQIGEWHISHDQQLAYMRELARLSDRITLTEYARTHEQRPLIYLTITSPDNHGNIDEIQEQHIALNTPGESTDMDPADMPIVLYQGFSIHGNEPSGGNAAPLVAYYLAAGQDNQVTTLLDNVVILFDPCYNPDGFTRFSTWANMHKNKNLTADPNDREYDEVWPGGRTNHYWFDLNRDWLLQQHPESQGRIETFHAWKPNVLTDHHEMGTNSTFFFMPGEPTRIYPITPQMNQDLTAKIGEFHAEALDDIGSLYYSGEGYDDFYVGKGSTYPDVNGCIGILFEQASSRGHLQESANGILSFPFTIRNQVATALSTHAACVNLREEILTFQRDFYNDAAREARQDDRAGFVFGEPHDQSRLDAFIEVLRRHQLEVYELDQDVTVDGQTFEQEHSYMVPMEQAQYRMVKAAFETITTFEDSLFYDVSTWTLPYAFDIPYAAVPRSGFSASALGDAVEGLRPDRTMNMPERSDYAYLLDWTDYYAPKALYYLQDHGLRTRLSDAPMMLDGREYGPGTVLIPVENQSKSPDEIYDLVRTAAEMSGANIYGASTGYTPQGPDLGSRGYSTIEKPEVLLLAGPGARSYDAGEAWHVLDTRYEVVVTKAEPSSLSGMDLDRYNVIIMPDGYYSGISSRGVENLQNWVSSGGTLIGMEGALRWLAQNGLAKLSFKSGDPTGVQSDRRPYNMRSRDGGGRVVGGSIFETRVDLTHPLAYGMRRDHLPVFRSGTTLLEPSENPYATPFMYTDQPLLSGYINKGNLENLRNTAAVIVSGRGRGKVICLQDNPNFRAFWYGTNRLFANAVFFGQAISGGATER
jgi:hypothetical protein